MTNKQQEVKLLGLNKRQKVQLLKRLIKDVKAMVACDEEWNTIYSKVEVKYDEDGNPIIFGLSGSEVDLIY